MDEKKFERLSQEWFHKSPYSLGAWHKEHVKLLRRVYRMGEKDGFSDGLRKAVEVKKFVEAMDVVSTDKKRGTTCKQARKLYGADIN